MARSPRTTLTRGTGVKSLLVRAVGPTLGVFGVSGALADPRMEVIPLGGTVATWSNDDWVVGGPAQTAFASAGAFALPASGSKDAALLANVTSPGSGYTLRITGPSAAAAGVYRALETAVPGPALAAQIVRLGTAIGAAMLARSSAPS